MNSPVKTVQVPHSALSYLFKSGNWSKNNGQLQAAEFARNAIEHWAFELRMIGECINNSDGRAFDDETLYNHCFDLSYQLEAAIEVIEALEQAEAATVKGGTE